MKKYAACNKLAHTLTVTALLLSLILAVFSFTPTFTAQIASADTVWDGSIDTSFYNSEDVSFDINSAAQLAGLAKLVNDGNNMEGKTFTLTSHITLGVISGETAPTPLSGHAWTPIGTNLSDGTLSRPFSGTFDGQGHAVDGLFVNTTDASAGLFGYVANGTVKDVDVASSYVIGSYNVGGLVGEMQDTTVSDCSFIGTLTADSLCGGIVGYASTTADDKTAVIKNCSASGKINSKLLYSGGIVGFAAAKYANSEIAVNDCTANMTVSGGGEVGGIVGSLHQDSDGIASAVKCSASGTLKLSQSGNIGTFGGVAGSNSGTLTLCSSDVDVVIGENSLQYLMAGGLVGQNIIGALIDRSFAAVDISVTVCPMQSAVLGGLVGRNDGSISDAYSAGSIVFDADYSSAVSLTVGGLVGQNSPSGVAPGSVARAYTVTEISLDLNSIGVGLHSATVEAGRATGSAAYGTFEDVFFSLSAATEFSDSAQPNADSTLSQSEVEGVSGLRQRYLTCVDALPDAFENFSDEVWTALDYAELPYDMIDGFYPQLSAFADGDNSHITSRVFIGTKMDGVTAVGYGGAFDGQPHSITVTVPAEKFPGAVVTYSLSQDGPYTAEQPQRTDVGTTKVYFKVDCGSYDSYFGAVDIVIIKALADLSSLDFKVHYARENAPVTIFDTAELPDGVAGVSYKIGTTIYSGEPLAVGSYQVTVSFRAANGYRDIADRTLTLRITSGDSAQINRPHKMSGGIIAGIVLACVCFVALATALALMVRKEMLKRKKEQDGNAQIAEQNAESKKDDDEDSGDDSAK